VISKFFDIKFFVISNIFIPDGIASKVDCQLVPNKSALDLSLLGSEEGSMMDSGMLDNSMLVSSGPGPSQKDSFAGSDVDGLHSGPN
jgi:hypothetical protein